MNQHSTVFSAREMTYIAMGAVIIAVCSWISIPATVPFTLQTFAVCLVTAVFGLKRGVWAVVVYILLGAVGIPVFSGFRGGLGALLGTTGGYIVGFIFTALIVGLAVKKFGRRPFVLAVFMAIGILVCYTFGTAWYMVVYAQKTGPIGIMTALGRCVFPYLIPDGLKIALAVLLTGRLSRLIPAECSEQKED